MDLLSGSSAVYDVSTVQSKGSSLIKEKKAVTFAITSYTTFANFLAGSFDGQALQESNPWYPPFL